jgi:hypothetical protein
MSVSDLAVLDTNVLVYAVGSERGNVRLPSANMPRFQLVISNRFRCDLWRLDAQIHARILEALAYFPCFSL